ncbi:hypothetical protein [Nocardiopsis potens]|nr:hypothetical protein [Nocardiopsis potens]
MARFLARTTAAFALSAALVGLTAAPAAADKWDRVITVCYLVIMCDN